MNRSRKIQLAQQCLLAAYGSIGAQLKNLPEFFLADQYEPRKDRLDALHVVLTDDQIEIHEYCSDYREHPHLVRRFPSLKAFVRLMAKQRIDSASVHWLAFERPGSLNLQKASDLQAFCEARRTYVAVLEQRLDDFLEGSTFLSLSRCYSDAGGSP